MKKAKNTKQEFVSKAELTIVRMSHLSSQGQEAWPFPLCPIFEGGIRMAITTIRLAILDPRPIIHGKGEIARLHESNVVVAATAQDYEAKNAK